MALLHILWAEDLLVFLENMDLLYWYQENSFACDNSMSLWVKKVALKETDRHFWAKNVVINFDKL